MLNRLFLISIISAAFLTVTAQAEPYSNPYDNKPYSNEQYSNEGSSTPAPPNPAASLYPQVDDYPGTVIPYDGNAGSGKGILMRNPGRRPF